MRRHTRNAIGLLFAALALAGCAVATTTSGIDASVSQMHPYPAAKPPECSMPVLKQYPSSGYVELAIVEGWAGSDQAQELLAKLKQEACGTGADALVVLSKKNQAAHHPNYVELGEAAEAAASSNEANIEQKAQSRYDAIISNSSMLGEPGHGGFYMEAVAVQFKPKGKSR